MKQRAVAITKGNAYRSGLERNVASQLETVGHRFGYETEKIAFLKPAKGANYNPDFILTKKDGTKMYIETKGRFVTADRQKHLLIKDQHPELDIRFLFQRSENTISKTSKTTYGKWATDKGFKWADGELIPKAWLKELKS